jgi:hypothetical protein
MRRATIALLCLAGAAAPAGAFGFSSRTQLKVDNKEGRLELTPGRLTRQRGEDSLALRTYVQLDGPPSDARIWVVSLLCGGERLVGFKGLHLRLAEADGVGVSELMATGLPAANLIARVQPWLFQIPKAERGLELGPHGLCSPAFQDAMRRFDLESMEAEGRSEWYSFRYDRRRGRLEVRWEPGAGATPR